MRRSLLIFLFFSVVVLIYLVHSVSTLLALLIEDASRDAIHRSELPALDSTLPDTRPQKIPKIIHQTYINESIPALWVPAQQSCIDLHPDYEYILWTDEKCHDFIAKEYPWFLSTFVGYKHNIQRADAIRYFVLAYYGGVYIDLDAGCKRRLDPLLSYDAFVRLTIPTGISNDVMGCVPQHPFFLRVQESLRGADRSWFLPYITIMASTGPLFLSVIWKKWMSEHAHLDPETWIGRVRVLMPDESKDHPWSFFEMYKGSSWHGSDARFIFWLGKNWVLLTVLGTLIVLTLGFLTWFVYSRLLIWSAGRRGARGSPRVVPSRVTGAGKMPLWRLWTGWLGKRQSYELVDHDEHDA